MKIFLFVIDVFSLLAGVCCQDENYSFLQTRLLNLMGGLKFIKIMLKQLKGNGMNLMSLQDFQIGTYFTKFVFQDDQVMEDEGNYVWIFKKESDGSYYLKA
jgi:hypothetical protein